MSSYQLAEHYNAQSFLWAIGGALHSAAMAVHTILLNVLFVLIVLAKALEFVALVAGAMTARRLP